ncbi:MAG: glycogen/starch/alpha-glucan phosphorylase, partial [Puniceicoccales bacterium]|nr:glycogen/starch/alpha-glucan phosphorylase [Puniceicoccales bacterium]
LKRSIQNHLRNTLARDTVTATPRDWWLAVCHAVRERILDRFIETQKTHHEGHLRRVYYFSLEYLMGRLLTNNLCSLGLLENTQQALRELGLDYDLVCQEESDMGLGNGGLGRLAACFLDSLATLGFPVIGYGIHYEFGLFRQAFVNGQQEEYPDNWLQFGNPWHIVRPEQRQTVKLYGQVSTEFNDQGDPRPQWKNFRTLCGIPWDIPIVGYGGQHVNFLRLWESRASEEFDLHVFNSGGYVEAVREKVIGETISKVLYPNDATESGKELRLVQQYFFVSCSLQDIIRRHKAGHTEWDTFPKKVVVQLNDTHPTVAIVELMRLLIDEEGLNWDRAWQICQKVFAYTNHTLLPEALEKWSVPLLSRVIPRHLQIIYEINHWFLENIVEKRWPGDDAKKRDLSIIEEGHPQYIRMAYLAVVASFSVNGVAKMHTELLRTKLFPLFDELYPGKFNNKTNGITPRRWIKVCNPRLSKLITETLGNEGWLTDLERLKGLESRAGDPEFQRKFFEVKQANKKDLSLLIKELCGIQVSPEAIFDVQIKRLHEYKRQHLNLLFILKRYRDLLHFPQEKFFPRVVIFGAKAAPGYRLAKDIIHAINEVARRINGDDRIQNRLKVAFIPNYSVSLASKIIPAADISQQISTAGKEASGTGNMKLGLNGACTVGTLDGANVEILESVGSENIFIFGKTAEEIHELQSRGYDPRTLYNTNGELKEILDWMGSGVFAHNGKDPVKAVQHRLLEEGDPFFALADFEDYVRAQQKAEQAYQDRKRWLKMTILNTARLGYFSSDRTVLEYVKDIWKVKKL